MSRTRKPESVIGQDALFSIEEAAVPEQVHPDEPLAPYVDLTKRAEYLISSLKILNNANGLNGLVIGASEPAHRPKIERRYEEKTDTVASHADAKTDRLLRGMKYPFAFASGMYAMRAAGVDEPKTKTLTRESHAEFLDEFGVGNAGAKKRNNYINKLKKYTKNN